MIRVANINDLESINNLGCLFNNSFAKVYDIKKYIGNVNYIILVNEDENINGLLIAYNNIDYLEIEGIAVAVNMRNKGIANNLLKYLINNYATNKKEILLEVAVDNIYAIKLYEKNNFEIINVRKKYYNGKDAYVMKRVV